MKILLATSNSHKVDEIKKFYQEFEIYALNDILTPFEIIENGNSFKENAMIKAKAVFEKLKEKNLQKEFIVLSDDSGICVDALNGAPGIYSARFSGENANDKSNREKLKNELKKLNLKNSKAHYTACIALASLYGDFYVYGFMDGEVIDEDRGENGFGYDFMFIPNLYSKTISQMPNEEKLKISHRSKALENAKFILKSLQKYYN